MFVALPTLPPNFPKVDTWAKASLSVNAKCTESTARRNKRQINAYASSVSNAGGGGGVIELYDKRDKPEIHTYV